jgi:hypothetical protein
MEFLFVRDYRAWDSALQPKLCLLAIRVKFRI